MDPTEKNFQQAHPGTDPDVAAYFELTKVRFLAQQAKDSELTTRGARLGVSSGVLFFYGLTIAHYGGFAAGLEHWAIDVLALAFFVSVILVIAITHPRKWFYPADMGEIKEDIEKNEIPNAVVKKIADSWADVAEKNKPQAKLKETLIKFLSLMIGVQVFCLLVLMDLMPQWLAAYI